MTRLLVAVVLLSSGSRIAAAQGSTPCTEQAAQDVGAFYYRLHPITEQTHPDRVLALVQAHKSLLAPDSPTIRCMRLVGRRLASQGLAAFAALDADHAYASALSMGANMDQAQRVAESITSESVDTWAMGQELIWLADVLPSAARGDWTLFGQTGTQERMSIRQVWPLYQQMSAMDPTMQPLLDGAMASIQDWVEYQVSVLAYRTGQ